MKTPSGPNSGLFLPYLKRISRIAGGQVIKALAVGRLAALLIVFFALSMPCSLFPSGRKEQPIETRVVTDMQARYDSLEAPGIMMLPVSGISAVTVDTLVALETELHRQMVNAGRMRPVRMDRWLTATYAANKAPSAFAIMNTIASEQFIFPIRYVGKPFVFTRGGHYYFILYVYSIETHYPITVMRRFAPRVDQLDKVVASVIEEMHERLPLLASRGAIRRVVVEDFPLEFYHRAQLPHGEFDFVPVPFIELDGAVLRSGDDFFSRAMGYILETTGLFRVIHTGDFRDYSNASMQAGTTLADYRIRGRVQISTHECILHVDVLNARTGAAEFSFRHPLLSYSFEGVWDAYRFISAQIIDRLFDDSSFGIVPTLEAPGRAFFVNGSLVGWDKLENFALPRGIHVISTGNGLQTERAGNSVNSYYVLLESKTAVYPNVIGKQIWNLLQK